MLIKHVKEHISNVVVEITRNLRIKLSNNIILIMLRSIVIGFINKWQIVICILYFEIHMCDYTSTLSVDFISKLFTT